MNPAALAVTLAGGLFVGAIAVGVWLDRRERQEAEATRRAKAYFEEPSTQAKELRR